MTNKIGWIVAGAIVFVLLLAGGVTALVVASGGDPQTVEEVADAAVDAAEDLDIDAGVDLLCDTPSKGDRDDLADLIDEAQDEADTDDPDVDYDVTNIKGDTEGSFDVEVSSDEPAFKDSGFKVTVLVEKHGDRSCISGYDDSDD